MRTKFNNAIFALVVLGLTLGPIVFISAQTATTCHSCYETRWQTQTATVRCDEAGSLVEEFQAKGFQTQIKVFYSDTNQERICDILASK